MKSALENREDGYYYPSEALEALTALGTAEARAVLQEKLAESARQSMSQKLLEAIDVSIRGIDLQTRLASLPPSAQVEELKGAFLQSLPESSSLVATSAYGSSANSARATSHHPGTS